MKETNDELMKKMDDRWTEGKEWKINQVIRIIDKRRKMTIESEVKNNW